MLTWLLALASTQTATTAPQVELVSIGIGSQMYAIFGHAALRVQKPGGEDLAYNFGGVNLEEPQFWLRLLQGRVKTYLDVKPYSQLLLDYSAEDRTIVRRRLALTATQAWQLVNALDAQAGSDDKYYIYHHVYDNCTTRAAHALDKVLGGALASQAQWPLGMTHRDHILDRLHHLPGLYVVMDLAGNGQGDVPMRAWDGIYMPDTLDQIVDKTEVNGGPLVVQKTLDYRSIDHDGGELWDWPWTKVYLFLMVPLILLAQLWPRLAVGLWGLLGGALGLIFIFFWVASDYDFYHRNWNMALFPPTHWFLVISAFFWRGPRVTAYLAIHAALVGLVGLVWFFGGITQAIGPMLALVLPLDLWLIFRVARRGRGEWVGRPPPIRSR